MTTVERIERIVKQEGKVMTIMADADVITAARQMHKSDIGCLVVVDSDARVVGIVTERDVLVKVVACAANPAVVRVADIMTVEVVSCETGTSISEAERIMAVHRVRHLPIVDDDMPVGMISSRDVMAYELSAAKAVANQQYRLLDDLEKQFPGITNLRKDAAGRVVI